MNHPRDDDQIGSADEESYLDSDQAEDDDENISTAEDLRNGLLLVIAGALIVTWGMLTARNGLPFFVWGIAFAIGPALLCVGGAAFVRLLLRRDTSRTE